MQRVTPGVRLVGITEFRHGGFPGDVDNSMQPYDGQHLIEAAGRACYQSFDKPNPTTRSNEDYLANILRQRHYSVLEHMQASFYLTGVSRNFTHELVRHRHFSFSELSQRYVDPVKAELGYVVPPALDDLPDTHKAVSTWWVLDSHETSLSEYEAALEALTENGTMGKRAREAARTFLLGSIETRIVVSGNLRAWIEFLQKRDHPAADAEMQQVAKLIGDALADEVPHVFGPDARALWSENHSQESPKWKTLENVPRSHLTGARYILSYE